MSQGRLLIRYGLARQIGTNVVVSSELIKMGLNELQTVDLRQPNLSEIVQSNTKISLSEDEWSEELAIIGKRRNLLEKALKQLIRFTLKARIDLV